MQVRDKALIVDGNNLLFQMFYGLPTKIYNKRGRTIHATIGFISALQRLIKSYQINRTAVVFDCDCSMERKQILEDYKANRRQDWDQLPQDEVPFFEEEYICQCLEYLGVCVLNSHGMEADDLIASLALSESKRADVFIASFDSDFFQLIDDSVSVIRYRGQNTKTITRQSFFEEYGFDPSRYALYKSLTGDSADNVKGVPMVGAKRAASIVQACANVQTLKNSELSFLSEKVKNSVKNSISLIERNLSLILLKEREIVGECQVFDKERATMTNSQILSACGVFN